MNVYRVGEVWYVEFDRRGVRLRRSTGQTSRRKAERYLTLLRDLMEADRWDVLRAIQANTLTLAQVAQHRTNLPALPTADAMALVSAVADGFIARRSAGTSTRPERQRPQRLTWPLWIELWIGRRIGLCLRDLHLHLHLHLHLSL